MTTLTEEPKRIESERSLKSSWPVFEQEEIDAVKRVLESGRVNYWTGEEARLFEQEFAEYIGCKYAVALANGTVALELSLEALGVGQGDEVVVTPRISPAARSCLREEELRAVASPTPLWISFNASSVFLFAPSNVLEARFPRSPPMFQ